MVLDEILAKKRPAVAERMRCCPREDLPYLAAPPPRSLRQRLLAPHCSYILECKKASPSRGLIRADFNIHDLAREYAPFADGISVLTDETYFQGQLDFLRQVRAVVDTPILCKDFVVNPYQVYEARSWGADAILLMASVLDDTQLTACLQAVHELGMDALVEVHDRQELLRVLPLDPPIIGINNRNLRDLSIDLSTTEELAPLIPSHIPLVSESGIGSHADVKRLRAGVHGFLVGTSLMQQSDVGTAARRLIFGTVKVCGLTRPEDIHDVWINGATYAGMIFAKQSPRCITNKQAEILCQTKNQRLRWVGIFVDDSLDRVASLAHDLNLAAVQLHGSEDEAFITKLRERLPTHTEVWKAIAIADRLPQTWPNGADRFLLDTSHGGQSGGTGKRFPWSLLRELPNRSEIILAGGLTPNSAEEADNLGVGGLDVNSGVEIIPGHKDSIKMKQFFAALRGVGRPTNPTR